MTRAGGAPVARAAEGGRTFRVLSESGARQAATALSQMVGRPVRLDVPWARLMPVEGVAEAAGGARRIVSAVWLRVFGGARGNLLLIFPADQVPSLLALLSPGKAPAAAAPPAPPPRAHAVPVLREPERSAIRELGNILGGAYLNAVSHLLGVTLLPSIPGLAVDMAAAVTDFLLAERGPEAGAALVLACQIREPASGVRAGIFFLPDRRTLDVLARAHDGGAAAALP